MSSPIFTIRSDPQHAQAVGASTTTRSRGRCSGNGFFTGLRRSKLRTFVAFSSAAAVSSSSSWSISRAVCSALRPYLSRLSMAILRPSISASDADTTAFERASSDLKAASSARSLPSSEAASDMVTIYHAGLRMPMQNRAKYAIYPTFAGRCVQRGLRQPIPSRR